MEYVRVRRYRRTNIVRIAARAPSAKACLQQTSARTNGRGGLQTHHADRAVERYVRRRWGTAWRRFLLPVSNHILYRPNHRLKHFQGRSAEPAEAAQRAIAEVFAVNNETAER